MSKQKILQRTLLLCLLYGMIFTLIVMIQFAKQGGFTWNIGPLTVSGYLRTAGNDDQALKLNEHFLLGDTSVLYGGMEFRIGALNDDEVLRISRNGMEWEALLANRIFIEDESISFLFPRGEELQFVSRQIGNIQELHISFDTPEETGELLLPFRPQGRTTIVNSGGGSFVAINGGASFRFVNLIPEGRLLTLRAGEALRYRAIPDNTAFNLGDFLLPQARTRNDFDAALNAWQRGNFSLWREALDDEETVLAFLGEALRNSSYRAAVSAIPPEFVNALQRTHASSAYLGRLDSALPSLANSERETLSRLSQLINENSLSLLLEPHVIDHFAIRGLGNYIAQGAELIRSMDSTALDLEIIPGIFQGYTDWRSQRGSERDNPFVDLIDEACYVISEALRTNLENNKVFAFQNNWADTEFNLRLGKALLDWAESQQNQIWAALGRSLILSALSMGDDSGSVSARLFLSYEGEIIEDSASPRLSSARLYHILYPGEYSPRAVAMVVNTATDFSTDNIWAWTAAGAISASLENNVLNISVSFPEGETHYMILRGIRPFTRIQLYNMDWPSDPQFEIYDSSGWVYVPAEQSLLLKMRHRASVENIGIFF